MAQVRAKETLPMRRFAKSYEMFDYNLLFIRWLADFCGVDMMVEHYRFNYRTGICIMVLWIGVTFSIYSLFFYYPDIYKISEVLVVSGIVVQGTVKFYYGFSHRKFYEMQYSRLRRLHYKYRNHQKINAKLLHLMERIHILSKLLWIVYFLGGLGYTIYPLYMHFKHGERVLMIAMRIPLVDADTLGGYLVTIVVQTIMIISACNGIAAADTVILLFVASLIAYVDVFTNELEDLNAMLSEEVHDRVRIREQVRKICSQHQDIIEYESDLDERYIMICFAHVVGTVVSMSTNLFLVYMIQFVPGYPIMLAVFCQLLEFCLLGTVLTVKNEEIIEAIYSAHWYLLPKPERCCFALMLHKSQNFIEMTIGGFAPLNLETFVAIMNRIYSYFMMLISFIE